MKKAITKYLWLFEMIGAALILGLGIIMGVIPSVLLVFVGLIFIVLGTLRIAPLVKTTDDKVLKIFFAVELIIEVIAGVLLMVIAFNQDKEAFSKQIVFGYIIAGILYLRGFVYLFSTAIRKDKTNFFIFIIHIALLTIASMIFARGGFTLKTLGIVLMVVAILCALFIGFDSFKKYQKYRNEEYALKKTKDIKQEENKKEAPTAEEVEIRVPEEEVNQDNLNA